MKIKAKKVKKLNESVNTSAQKLYYIEHPDFEAEGIDADEWYDENDEGLIHMIARTYFEPYIIRNVDPHTRTYRNPFTEKTFSIDDAAAIEDIIKTVSETTSGIGSSTLMDGYSELVQMIDEILDNIAG